MRRIKSLLFIVPLFVWCSSILFSEPVQAGNSETEIIAAIKKKQLVPWDAVITTTDSNKAPGWILRGKTNLKVTGPVPSEKLSSIRSALFDMKNSNPKQMIRLDLSESTEIEMIPESCFSGLSTLAYFIAPQSVTTFDENS